MGQSAWLTRCEWSGREDLICQLRYLRSEQPVENYRCNRKTKHLKWHINSKSANKYVETGAKSFDSCAFKCKWWLHLEKVIVFVVFWHDAGLGKLAQIKHVRWFHQKISHHTRRIPMIRERHKGAPSIAVAAVVAQRCAAADEQRQRALQAYQLLLSFQTTFQFYLSSWTPCDAATACCDLDVEKIGKSPKETTHRSTTTGKLVLIWNRDA